MLLLICVPCCKKITRCPFYAARCLTRCVQPDVPRCQYHRSNIVPGSDTINGCSPAARSGKVCNLELSVRWVAPLGDASQCGCESIKSALSSVCAPAIRYLSAPRTNCTMDVVDVVMMVMSNPTSFAANCLETFVTHGCATIELTYYNTTVLSRRGLLIPFKYFVYIYELFERTAASRAK